LTEGAQFNPLYACDLPASRGAAYWTQLPRLTAGVGQKWRGSRRIDAYPMDPNNRTHDAGEINRLMAVPIPNMMT
jgi:hypothetical protein